MHRMPRMESSFTQESESAVFGKLTKNGRLQLSRGGRFRVTYTKGIVVVSDGDQLIHYDSSIRTAQRMELRAAIRDMPLLNVLVNPDAIESFYSVTGSSETRVVLEPKRKDLPVVVVEGQSGFLRRISWTDPTGAKQVFSLKDPHSPKNGFPVSTFQFTAPAGTRWIP
jgi:outer membrane lipoprotein-sorting protein